ncbi:outer membrane protein assembly factor BamB family protein [Halomarina ordinaria]|uniref:PQQ-binding-like beta-propeller repeat protein n=1 Tax=Halomarina ordinaria TaxID=3033939 RepID=A0ABD5U6K0_9EURY|nr:PQQ-binding-like beta-propeller repeat protein [Halomarina sp. PSRA2]
MPSRRRFLAHSSALGLGALGGCVDALGSDRPTYTTPGTDGPPPPPEHHAFGSDGQWSSPGFDASNTRWDYRGSAPRDDARVRWRYPVQEGRAPTVSNGQVFVSAPGELVVLDAMEGEELWTAPTEPSWVGVPLVRNATAYVPVETDLRALDAVTGEELWSRSADERFTPPATVGGEELVVGNGEYVRALDAETGEERRSRRLYGTVNAPALGTTRSPTTTTQAGEVYVLERDGTGVWRRTLRASIEAPVTLGRDYAYVTEVDDTLRALDHGGETVWRAEGVADFRFGVAYTDAYVYAVDGSTLHALDSDSGEEHWAHHLGERAGVPAVVDDTVYVGGDRLHALDPEGTGERFSVDLGGRVGPDVSAGDGALYVPVTDDEGTDLVALETA